MVHERPNPQPSVCSLLRGSPKDKGDNFRGPDEGSRGVWRAAAARDAHTPRVPAATAPRRPTAASQAPNAPAAQCTAKPKAQPLAWWTFRGTLC